MDRVEALTQGYWLARELLDARPLGALRREILAYCARRGWLDGRRGFRHDDAEFIELQVEAQASAGLAEVRAHPRLRAAAAELLGGPAIGGQGDVCRVVFPNAPEFTTPAHKDEDYLKRGEPVWTAWIPLADCPKRQGGLSVSTDGTEWEEFNFKAGDVLWVNARTLHKALDNVSEEVRVSVDLRFRK